NTSNTTPAVAGQQLFQTLGCVSCHGATGEGGRGPALNGLFGRETQLVGGQKITADEAYIRESILNPQAQLVDGFGPIMPTFQGQISEDQLVQLLAYIKSLQAPGAQPAAAASPAAARPASQPSPASSR